LLLSLLCIAIALLLCIGALLTWCALIMSCIADCSYMCSCVAKFVKLECDRVGRRRFPPPGHEHELTLNRWTRALKPQMPRRMYTALLPPAHPCLPPQSWTPPRAPTTPLLCPFGCRRLADDVNSTRVPACPRGLDQDPTST
jgi:hypothetical protein